MTVIRVLFRQRKRGAISLAFHSGLQARQQVGFYRLSIPETLVVRLPSVYEVGGCIQDLGNVEDQDHYVFKEEFLLLRFVQLYKMNDPRHLLYLSEMPQARKMIEAWKTRESTLGN